MKIITSKQAREQGLKRFFTGKACPNGHIDERLVSSGSCITCRKLVKIKDYHKNREAILAKRKQYYANNPDKAEEQRIKRLQWYKDNKERVSANNRRYREANREHLALQNAEWRAANALKIKQWGLERYKTHGHSIRAAALAWAKNNPRRVNARNATRRAAEMKACPVWVDRAEIAEIYANCPEGYHVDHEVPLNHPLICGLHVPVNLQYLPAFDNLSKGNRFDPETYVHVFP